MYFISLVTILSGLLFSRSSAVIAVDYYVHDSSINGNSLELFCHDVSSNRQRIDVLSEATIEFFEELDSESTPIRRSRASPLSLNYMVTSNSERFVRCVFGEEVSTFLAIGGSY